MSTEYPVEDEIPEVQAPPPEPPAPNGHTEARAEVKPDAKAKAPKKSAEPAAPEDDESKKAVKLTKPLKELRDAEDGALRDWLQSLGIEGSEIRIQVHRKDPDTARDPSTGQMVTVSGHLKNYSEFIDEEFIQQKHGGGKYELRVQKRDPSGKYQYFKTRTLQVAGDPRTDDVPRNVAKMSPMAAALVTPAAEPPSVVTKAMEMMERQLEHERDRVPAVAPATDYSPIVEQFKATISMLEGQLKARDDTLRDMRAEISAIRNQKPEEDPFKQKLISNLLDGDSARLVQLRETHASELRQAKQSAIDDEKRLRDSFERDRAAIVQSHEREISTMKSSHELALSVARQSFETQTKILEAQNRSLEREITDLRSELKELRAKKEKSIVEQVKEMEVIKDALGIGDDKESSWTDKVAEVVANPDAIKAARDIFRGPGAAAGAQPAAQAPSPPKQQRVIATTPDGQKWSMEPDGSLRKVKKRVAPGEIDLPQVPPETIAKAVELLEKAFTGGQEPETVATSAKLLVPAEILNALRDVGPDIFMSKMARLPPTSPLANQQGRNWVRKVARALTG